MLRLVVVLVAVMASGVAWAQAGSEHGVQVGMGLALGVTLGPFEGRSRVHVVTHAFSEATVRWDAENRGLRRAPWVRPVLGGSLAVRIRRPVQVEPMARAGVALLDDAAGNLGHITRARGVFDAGIAWRPATGEVADRFGVDARWFVARVASRFSSQGDETLDIGVEGGFVNGIIRSEPGLYVH